MLIDFFCKVRDHQIPCTLRELLDLIRALEKGVVFASIDDFYSLSRTVLVKDEVHFDKFDRAFADYFKGVASLELDLSGIPEDWLRKHFEKQLSAEEKAKIKALGGLDKLMNRRSVTKVEINGLVLVALRPLARTGITLKGSE